MLIHGPRTKCPIRTLLIHVPRTKYPISCYHVIAVWSVRRAISRGGAHPLHPHIHASPSLNQFGAARSRYYHKHIALIHLTLTHTDSQYVTQRVRAATSTDTIPSSSLIQFPLMGMFLTESPGVLGTNYQNCISYLLLPIQISSTEVGISERNFVL